MTEHTCDIEQCFARVLAQGLDPFTDRRVRHALALWKSGERREAVATLRSIVDRQVGVPIDQVIEPFRSLFALHGLAEGHLRGLPLTRPGPTRST